MTSDAPIRASGAYRKDAVLGDGVLWGTGRRSGDEGVHHKTQHWYFKAFFPVLLIVQIILLAIGAYLLMR